MAFERRRLLAVAYLYSGGDGDQLHRRAGRNGRARCAEHGGSARWVLLTLPVTVLTLSLFLFVINA
jgi:hypothetical protein